MPIHLSDEGPLHRLTPSDGLKRAMRGALPPGGGGAHHRDTTLDVLLADLASGHVAATTAAGQLMELLTTALGTGGSAVKWRALTASCLEVLAELVSYSSSSIHLVDGAIATSWRASNRCHHRRPSSVAVAAPLALECAASGNSIPALARATSFESVANAIRGDSPLLPGVHFTTTNSSDERDRTPPVSISPVAHANLATIGDEEIDGSFTINQHLVLMPIGRGSQGEVFLAMDTTRNKLRAVKAIRRPKGDPVDDSGQLQGSAMAAARRTRRQQLEKEIAVMKRCRHRNLVALHEVIDDPQLDVMYLVMQYVENGPIARLSAEGTIEKTIPPAKLAEYASQIVSGLHYLHSNGVIHRDIKPDNVLIGSNDDVYLADFGTSELFECNSANIRVRGTRGTLAFMAPELFDLHAEDDCSHGGPAVDVWALGVTFYVLLYGKLPWTSTSAASLCEEILSASVLVPPTRSTADSSTTPTLESRTDTAVPSPTGVVPLPEFFDTSLSARPESQQSTPYLNPSTVMNSSQTPSAFSARRRLPMSAPRRGGDLYFLSATMPLEDMWAVLLSGMLRRDPTQRLTLREVAAKLRDMKDALSFDAASTTSQLAASLADMGASPISVIRRTSRAP